MARSSSQERGRAGAVHLSMCDVHRVYFAVDCLLGLRILCSLNLQLCYAFMLALCCDYAFNLCNYAQLCSTKVS